MKIIGVENKILFLKKRLMAHSFRLAAFLLFLLSVLGALAFFIFVDKNNVGNVEVLTGKELSTHGRWSVDNENKEIQKAIKFDDEQKDAGKLVDAVKPTKVQSKDYTQIFPDFYTRRPEKQLVYDKTIYLTFDDGPSERTPEILDILKKYNIKATFFVVGKTDNFSKECMKRIVEEGHTIAMHSYTHDFKKIYSSVESFLEDMHKLYNLIYEVTGVKPSIFRFAGGSRNGFNKSNYKEIISEMLRRGFDYFDWNICNNDSVSKSLLPVEKCVDNVCKYSSKYNSAVVLMHDSKPKTTTVEALPKVIEKLKNQGFSFRNLTNEVYPCDFALAKPYA